MQVYQMTTNFERFVEFNGVLQEWKVLRDEKDAEQVLQIQSLPVFGNFKQQNIKIGQQKKSHHSSHILGLR